MVVVTVLPGRVRTSYKGYPLKVTENQRQLGPLPFMDDCCPENSEIFICRLPATVLECDVYNFCESIGGIFEIRVVTCEGGTRNRGFSFVRFLDPIKAKHAIEVLNDREIVPGSPVRVLKSIENSRLFIGGIPITKTEEDLLDELENNGVLGVVNIFMYKSYSNKKYNRGFAFIEFKNHYEATLVRLKFLNRLLLWNLPVVIDWARPMPPTDPSVMEKVQKLFLRNLDLSQTLFELKAQIFQALDNGATVTKVYKHRNYAFIHFADRESALSAHEKLTEHYLSVDPVIEVTWATPPYTYKPLRNKNDISESSFNCCEECGFLKDFATTNHNQSFVGEKLYTDLPNIVTNQALTNICNLWNLMRVIKLDVAEKEDQTSLHK